MLPAWMLSAVLFVQYSSMKLTLILLIEDPKFGHNLLAGQEKHNLANTTFFLFSQGSPCPVQSSQNLVRVQFITNSYTNYGQGFNLTYYTTDPGTTPSQITLPAG